MKVLITGGYGFIGSHVAERFYKEGYEIYIIDNLSTGKKNNLTIKHKSFVMSVDDEKCEEIFRANQFDVVVHLAAQVSVEVSVKNPRLDSEANVLGLVNMLDLSRKYRVKKFIFASSAAVYGEKSALPIREEDTCSPISPYGISKWVGESYCKKWQELYGLETIGFRFSNVYGPKQDARGEGGVVSVFMSRLLDGQPLVIHGNGQQTRDFIYVEDVADAIYRASYSTLTGVYNLSTNTECSINELAETMAALQDMKPFQYTEQRAGDIDRSVLSNEKIQKELDWAPMYSLREGLQRTYAYFLNEQFEKEAAASAATVKPAFRLGNGPKKLIPYAENIVAFGLTAWLTLGQPYGDIGAVDVKLFYITIMGILYGNKQSIIAVFLSVFLLGYRKILEGREVISLLYDTDFFFQIAMYVFIGLVVGYAIERKNNQIAVQEQKIIELESRYDFLNGVYQDVREVKDELQQRILNSGDSYGKIYSITKELESLEPENVFNATVNVVQSIIDVPVVSIYTMNRSQTFMRLVARSAQGAGQQAKSLRVEDQAYLKPLLEEGKLFVNKKLDADAPLMCAPIFYKDTVVAVVTIDGLPFEKFSLYHQNLFKTTTDLVASALTKAITYLEATESQRYVEGTSVLRPDVFQSVLESKKQAMEKNGTPFLLLKGKAGANLEETSSRIVGMLRETDYMGFTKDQDLMIILSNTSVDDAQYVLKRLADSGIDMQVVQEGI